MTDDDALRAELAATKRALRLALDGITTLIIEHPELRPQLHRLRAAVHEKMVWND